VSASVANPTSAAALTFTLGAITPTTVNGITLSGSSTPTLVVSGTTTVSGANTGDNAVNTLYSSLVSNATHTGDATGSTALTVVKINGTLLSGLATGLLKNTTGTGVPSIATVGVDYVIPSGNVATATRWATARTINGVSVDGTANVSVPSNIVAGTAGNLMTSTGTVWSSATLATIDYDAVPNLQITGALTDGTPTAAEINTATGLTPATAGAGYHRTIKDTTGTALLYRIESDGTSWFFNAMIKAL
jgi:hypothetical protein